MTPIFFESPAAFYKWLEKNHASTSEVFVGSYKVSTGKCAMSWSEAVDQALCFGWIDGIRRSIDSESYQTRFTPRKPGSNWSLINIKKVEALKKAGLMHPAGLAAYEKRLEHRTGIYSFENPPEKLSDNYIKKFRENKRAWEFFESLAPSYKRTAIYWVMTAKQELTRERRLENLIEASEKGVRLK